MFVLATGTFTDRSQLAPLITAEVEQVHQLRHEGVILSAYRRTDGVGTVLILQAASIADARERLSRLPFVRNELMTVEFAELAPL